MLHLGSVMSVNYKYGLQERCDLHVLGAVHDKGI
jgi:hypothetical protein